MSWWPAEGNANDIIGTNNGTMFNGVTFTNGEVGLAFSFTGGANNAPHPYIDVPYSSTLAPNNYTIEVWLEPNGQPVNNENQDFVFGQGSGVCQLVVRTGTTGLYVALQFSSGGSFPAVASTNQIPLGQFSHVAGTWDGTTLKLYINGTLNNASTPGLTPSDSHADFNIGGVSNAQFFNGAIDEISYYSRALSIAEIQSIYNAGSGGKCTQSMAPFIATQPFSQTNLVGSTASFTVAATGTPPLVYQWSFNGTNINGATNSILTLTNIQLNQAGGYSVLITNAYGSTNSSTAALSVNLPPPCDQVPAGIMAWWPAEGNANDIINSNNGTANGALTYAAGLDGLAFVFDESTSYVSVPASPTLDIGSSGSGITIETWIEPNSFNINTSGGPIIEWDSSTTDGLQLWVGNNAISANIKDLSNGAHTMNASAIMSSNTWQHLALTYDKTNGWAYIYFNGNIVSSNNFGTIIPQTTYPLNIGRRTGEPIGNGETYGGLIDELSIYNRALSQAEIQAIVSVGSGGKCFTPTPPFIITQPVGKTNLIGTTASFSVNATGTSPLAYQWSFNSTNINGATNSVLILNNVQLSQAGNYSVLITNLYGSTNSSIAILAVTNPPPCDTAPAGIISWWPGEGNANDVINTNNGITNNITYAPGEVGQAFVFNGSSSFVRIPASASMNVGTNNIGFTVEAWVNPAGAAIDNLQEIFQWNLASGSGGTPIGVQLELSGNFDAGLHLNIIDTTLTAHQLYSASGIMTGNTWQHVAATYDEQTGNAVIYRNGIAVVSANLGTGYTPWTSPDLYLGCRPAGSFANFFNGMIDEAAVYNRPLSSNEIAAIYNAGGSGKCIPPAPPVITSQPIGQTNVVNSTASFSVTATGTAPLYYFWRLNGTNLLNATNSILTLSNLTLNQAGNYDVIVSNYVGSVTSAPAFLDVRFILIEVNGQPATGTVTAISPATITLLGGYPGGFLFYTLDGSAPSLGSAQYTIPFALTNSALIRVLSLSSDFRQQTEGTPVTVQITPTYTLQTSIVGSGTITTNPPGGVYASNMVVTLTATPAAHWSFDHWAGDTNSTSNPLSVTMNSPRNIQAVFVQTQFPLTLTTPGGGTVTANPSSTYYNTGAVVALTATPASGWVFLGWQGSIISTNNPYSLTITQTNVIQGIFGTVAVTNAAGGAVVLSVPNPVPYGTSLAVSAVPNLGNYFVNWSGNLSGTISPVRYTVNAANPTFGALFTPLPTNKFTVTAVVNGNGFVSVSPTVSPNYYTSNSSVSLLASPNAGTYFFGWSQNATGNTSPLSVVVKSNTVIQANFGTNPVVSVSPPSQFVYAGSNATFTASAMGYQSLTYQWWNSLGIIPGAIGTSFTVTNVQPAASTNYWVVVSSSVGSVTSSVASISIVGAPVITNQPAPMTVTVGHSAGFTVGASGAPNLAYLWQLNGSTISKTANSTLTISNAFPANSGSYVVVVTNLYGATTSSPASLSVLPLNILVPAKIVAGQFQITFDTASGINYEVEYSTDLLNWSPWLYVGGNGQPVTLTDPAASGNTPRFYRIVLTPQ